VAHGFFQFFQTCWFHHVAAGAVIVAILHVVWVVGTAENEYRHVVQPGVVLKNFQQFYATHSGHVEVNNHYGNFFEICLQKVLEHVRSLKEVDELRSLV